MSLNMILWFSFYCNFFCNLHLLSPFLFFILFFSFLLYFASNSSQSLRRFFLFPLILYLCVPPSVSLSVSVSLSGNEWGSLNHILTAAYRRRWMVYWQNHGHFCAEAALCSQWGFEKGWKDDAIPLLKQHNGC